MHKKLTYHGVKEHHILLRRNYLSKRQKKRRPFTTSFLVATPVQALHKRKKKTSSCPVPDSNWRPWDIYSLEQSYVVI